LRSVRRAALKKAPSSTPAFGGRIEAILVFGGPLDVLSFGIFKGEFEEGGKGAWMLVGWGIINDVYRLYASETEVGVDLNLHLVFWVRRKREGLFGKLGEVAGEELGHAEGADAVVTEHLGHLLVGGEVLLVLGVLEVVLLDVGPQLLDALGAGRLLLPDDVGQLGAELHGLGETGSLRHFGGGG